MVDIAYCKIFPSIGVARLGDSDDFYLGPEAPGVAPDPVGGFKDVDGAIKRQGARFRIYGFDAADRVVRELTAAEATITWSVSLANTKADWFQFDGVRAGQALDKQGDPAKRRNLEVADRAQLRITPNPRRITGADQHGDAYRFDDGLFFGARVYLGELRTDDHGRLIVLGGKGQSGCTADGAPLHTYANNDYWHDDTSDGPVTATVTLAGSDVPVRGGAWLLVAPPKFAPNHRNIITLFDVMTEAAGIKSAAQLSFTRDIYPVFDRMASYQWVNVMALRGHGPRKPGNFHDPAIIAKLADNSPAGAAYRQGVLARIRNPRHHTVDQANYRLMPILSGDEGDATVGSPETWLYLLESQYFVLERWARGEFASDWTDPAPPALDQLAVADQPAALTRAALEYCVGGPFFPGIEMTYVARYADWYVEPYRFKDGMFSAGDMTKRMAVPWQADFFECQIHWWPAQRPDDVLNEDMFDEALASGRFQDEARDGQLAGALLDRIRWDRGVGERWRLPPSATRPADPARRPLPGDNDMVTAWKMLGFVEPRKTPQGEVLYVETGRSRYDGLRDRDYFFYLLNIDAFPDFLPRAKQLAEQFLRDARARLDDPDPSALDDMYRDFEYSPALLAQRLDEIYAAYAAEAELDPLADPDNPFQTAEDMKERIRQFAPLNQMDGAWIRNVAHAGPIDRVTANLFNIWMDEMGDGNPEQNHANVYTQLLAKVGIQLDPVSSR